MMRRVFLDWSRRMALLTVVCGMMAGCATPEKKVADLFWPLPPDSPKIQYEGKLEGAKDVEPKKGFFGKVKDFLFGEEEKPVMLRPYAISAASGGKVFITDTGSQVVHFFDTEQKKYRQVFKIPGGRLDVPVGIALDSDGSFYVSDSGWKRVFQFSPDGVFMRVFPAEFVRPAGIAVNAAEKVLYVVDSGAHRVLVFRLSGEKLFEIGRRGIGEGEFNFPTHITVDPKNGDLYVADSMNFRVERFNRDGQFIRTIGGSGDKIGHFSKLKGVSVDSEGILYTVDGLYDTVQMFSASGDFLMNFGRAGNREGEFWMPAGVAISGKEIFVADTYNHRVEIFKRVNPVREAGEKGK